jgi:hypothetical protein
MREVLRFLVVRRVHGFSLVPCWRRQARNWGTRRSGAGRKAMFFMGYVGSRPLGDQEPKVVVKNIFNLFWRNNHFRSASQITSWAPGATFVVGKWRDNASLGAHRAPLQIDQLAEFLQVES